MYFWNIPQCNPSKPGGSIIADQKDKQCLRPYRRCLCGIPYPETSGNGSSQLGRCQRHQDWECRTLEKDLGADRRASLNINSKSREVGVELDKEENTCLTDPHKMYEEGIGDLPDMKYKWRYDNSKAGSPYRLMRDAADKKEIWDFQEKTKDGTVTEFTAQFSVKRTGGGINGVIEFEVTMAVQSEIKQTDPA
ncbi:hypothetical protein [Blautia sp.]|uniref:hypothetical protein n=1 Tax=Blautia sp. TaxID=1955243 RepID=UPI003AB20A1B